MHPAIAALYTSQGERPRAERAVVYDLTYAVEMATGVAWEEFPTRTGGLGGRTRLHQLYRQIKDRHPGLTVEKFQRALGAMHLDGDVILGAHTQALERRDGQDGPLLISDEEMPFLMPMDKQMYRYLEPGDERSKRLGKERRERQAWQEEQARRGQEKAQQG